VSGRRVRSHGGFARLGPRFGPGVPRRGPGWPPPCRGPGAPQRARFLGRRGRVAHGTAVGDARSSQSESEQLKR